MDALREHLLPRLRPFVPALEVLLGGLPAPDLRWRPSAGGWSLNEIVGHLLDEEREDFRPRLRSTLEDPARPWAPIDPEARVRERQHQQADAQALLAALRREREDSLVWLEGLGPVDWNRAHAHPALGRLSAGDLLASWAAHDALHLRQVARRLHELVARDAAPHGPGYAGPWGH